MCPAARNMRIIIDYCCAQCGTHTYERRLARLVLSIPVKEMSRSIRNIKWEKKKNGSHVLRGCGGTVCCSVSVITNAIFAHLVLTPRGRWFSHSRLTLPVTGRPYWRCIADTFVQPCFDCEIFVLSIRILRIDPAKLVSDRVLECTSICRKSHSLYI